MKLYKLLESIIEMVEVDESVLEREVCVEVSLGPKGEIDAVSIDSISLSNYEPDPGIEDEQLVILAMGESFEWVAKE